MQTAIKNICLIETAGHGEVLRSLVLCYLEGGWFVHVISGHLNLDFLNGIHSDHLKAVEIEREDLLKSVLEALVKKEEMKVLFVTMPGKNWLGKLGKVSDQSCVLLHNLNFIMAPYSNIFFLRRPMKGVRPLLRFIKYLPEVIWERKAVKTKFNKRFYPAGLMPNKKLIPLYLSYPERAFVVPGGEWVVGIPGSVDSSRDYGQVLSVLDEIGREKGKKMRVELLGKVRQKSKKVWDEASFPHLQIQYYDEHLSYEDFSKKMENVSFLIAPVQEEKDYKGILEWKGKTNITGVVNDAIRYGKVCYIPNFYPFEKELKGLFKSYLGEKDLKNQIIKLMEGQDWPEEEEINDQLQTHRRSVVRHNTTVI